MKIFAYMEHGKNKTNSEDTMILNGLVCKDGYFCFETPGKCIAIADGVGGNAGGQEASEFVANMLKEGIRNNIKETVYKINEELISYAKNISGKELMATTLTALLFNYDKPICIIHVGNTRLYAIQGEYLKQLTRDHTTIEYLRSRGDFDAADIAAKNEITACFGAGNKAIISQLQIYEIEKNYAGYVITSDGIHDYLDEEIIEEFINSENFSRNAFESLFEQAKQNGSSDDMSIIVFKSQE